MWECYGPIKKVPDTPHQAQTTPPELGNAERSIEEYRGGGETVGNLPS